MSARFRRWCDNALEAMWLLAIVLVTLYFNIYTKDSRIFEPQKALVLRSLVTLMLGVWAARTLEEKREELAQTTWWARAVLGVGLGSATLAVVLLVVRLLTWKDPLLGMLTWEPGATRLFEIGPTPFGPRLLQAGLEMVGTFFILFATGLALLAAGYALRRSWREALQTSLVIPALAYGAVHIVATIGSVFPTASLYGGYVRQQGTLTVLAYIGLFFILAFNLRRREQLNRLITVILLSSIPAALYGIVQKLGIDPLPWMGDVEFRVASTMGNAIFIAAYLIMILPLTGYRFLSAWDRLRQSFPLEKTPGGRSAILGGTYPVLLGVLLGIAVLGATAGGALVYSAEATRLEKSGLTASEIAARVWQPYGHQLLLFLIAILGTLAIPALIYLLVTLAGRRFRPYAHVAALAAAVAGAAAIVGQQSMRTNGFVWAGYLAGLAALALLGRWQDAAQPWGPDALWADATYILILVQSLVLFQVIKLWLPTRPEPTLWWFYLVALIAFLASCYPMLTAQSRGRIGYLTQMLGYGLLALLQTACIVLTQSRGPLLGLLAGVFFAFPVVWLLRRRARVALGMFLGLAVLGLALLAVFNLPDTPLLGKVVMRNPQMASFVEQRIEPLKKIPYLGRLGRLADATSGTGKVRVLIWFGDEIGTGSVGMIFAHPLRTLIGYGPESMHVAYNPYYPPELAHVERRNASPDRAHNAVIDELITLGALGLAAYWFYFLAFFVLVWRLLWKAPDVPSQALGTSLFSLGVAHFFETLFGIPIVSTRMFMWIAMAIAVALTCMSPFREPLPHEEALEMPAEGPRGGHRKARRRSRGALPSRGIPGNWRVLYAILLLGALLFTSRFHLRQMRADILFWQSQQMQAQASVYQQQAGKETDEKRRKTYSEEAIRYAGQGLLSLQRAISLIPYEDFYYLSLAQLYLGAAEESSLDADREALFESTRMAIERARDLSPLNTDHYRNLSALYQGWFQATQQPQKLVRAILYGQQAISMTPNNADLRNRLSQIYLLAAYSSDAARAAAVPLAKAWLEDWESAHRTSGGRAGNTQLPIVARYREEALSRFSEGQDQEALTILAAAELHYSLFLDEEYGDTYQWLGDLYWMRGMYEEAAWMYGKGLPLKPALLSQQQSIAYAIWARQHAEEARNPVEARVKPLVAAGVDEPVVQVLQEIGRRAEAELMQPRLRESRAKTLHNQAFDAYQILGYIYILRKDHPAAISSLERALTHKDAYEVHKNLALLYYETGNLEGALRETATALKMAQEKGSSEDVSALQQFAQNIQELQDAEARAAQNPNDYQAYWNLAQLYRKAGQLQEALSAAKRALALAPAEKQSEVQSLVDALRQALGVSP
ncbi:MAG: O-antigen ligase family protein [Chloroflexia bacterium]